MHGKGRFSADLSAEFTSDDRSWMVLRRCVEKHLCIIGIPLD